MWVARIETSMTTRISFTSRRELVLWVEPTKTHAMGSKEEACRTASIITVCGGKL